MRWTILVGVLLGGAVPTAFGGPIYVVTDLGTLGGNSAAAFALNDFGVAAGMSTTPLGYSHAFLSSGTPTDLTPATNGREAGAYGINDAGSVSGTVYTNGQAMATVWSGGGAQPLGTLGGGQSWATGINDVGQVAGMGITQSGQGHAFLYSNGALVDLGTLAGGDWSSAYGINGFGQAAGYGNTASGAFHAALWSGGTVADLGTLGGQNSYGMAINDSGEVAGNSQVASGYAHAFLWDGATMIDLGTLGGGSSYAYGMNDSGQVAGTSWVSGDTATHAFLYWRGILYDLNTMIDAGSGWELTAAYAINSSGQIVGSGLLGGQEHAFRLDLTSLDGSGWFEAANQATAEAPEPATFWLVIVTVGCTVAAARRWGLRSGSAKIVVDEGACRADVLSDAARGGRRQSCARGAHAAVPDRPHTD